jgi:hypothetical protein
MKAKHFLTIALLGFTVLSCKNQDSKTEETTQEVVNNRFKITLNATVKKDDDFQVYYKEASDLSNPFSEEKSMYVAVKGSETPQDIVFELPEGAKPAALRMDFGLKKDLGDIVVNRFSIEYKGKRIDASGTTFFDMFRPDESFVKVDKATAKITPIVAKDGNYDPMMFSVESLDKQMAELVK